MAFPESFIQELVERSDIVDVVSGYVRLNKKSGSNLFGLCPFHSEKTPSFSVNSEKQIFHCFGCGKGGSVLGFIMEIENLSYPEAVEFLARRAGLDVPEEGHDATRERRDRMLRLNREAARFFYDTLMSPLGAPGRAYIEKRGISPATARAFGLGYAPDGWSALANAMASRGYTNRELFDAGLVRNGKSGGVYDTFRNRLVFPIIDVRGNVLAFSGRILGDGEPKYLNSPETLVFSKSRNLFALNLAKKSKSGYIILAEGNVDVVSLHQAGFDSAVASLGTSLTPEQARLLARYTGQVVIAYDNDGAGQKAAQRAIGIMEPLELTVRVLRMEGAKDPDEYIRARGPDAFRKLLERSENHIEYRLQTVEDKFDLSSDEGRVGFLREAAALIAAIPSGVEREVYGGRAAEKAGVSPQAMALEVAAARKKLASKEKKAQERETQRPIKAAQPREKELRYENIRSARAEQGVLSLLCRFPEMFQGAPPVAASEFSSPLLARFYSALLKRAGAGESLTVAALSAEFTPDETGLLTGIMQGAGPPAANRDKALSDYINIIRTEKKKSAGDQDLASLAAELKRTKGYGDKNGK